VGDVFVASSVRPDKCRDTRLMFLYSVVVEDRRITLLDEQRETFKNVIIRLSLG
jgi:hypothetical protein